MFQLTIPRGLATVIGAGRAEQIYWNVLAISLSTLCFQALQFIFVFMDTLWWTPQWFARESNGRSQSYHATILKFPDTTEFDGKNFR